MGDLDLLALPPPALMSRSTDGHGIETITVNSARPFPFMRLALSVLGLGFLIFILLYDSPRKGRAPAMVAVPGLAAIFYVARLAIRDLRGCDRLTFRRNFLEIERRGAFLVLTDRVPYGQIAELQTEEQPAPVVGRRMIWEKVGWRLILLRTGDVHLRIADNLGHGPEAASWLAAQIEQQARDHRLAP